MTLSLLHGNALALPLADRSVHLVVTSPPYFSLRSYRDGDEHFDGQLGSETTPRHFLAALWAVMDECHRVLRDDGSAWINLGDKFAGSGGNNNAGVGGSKRGPSAYNQNAGGLRSKSRMLLPHRFAEGLIDPDYRRYVEARIGISPTLDPFVALGDDGEPMFPRPHPQWICRMDAVWSKANGLPEPVTDRVRASHENWFHFVKSERYYAALDEIREGYTPRAIEQAAADLRSEAERRNNRAHTKSGGEWSAGSPGLNSLGKTPGSVWTVATEPLTLPEFMVPEYPGQLEPRWVMKRKDAWRWMRDTGIDTSPWPQQPEDGRQLRAAPSHFAAFPSYFPKRIIAGWSPSGVCTACGEGRRPAGEKRLVPLAVRTDAARQRKTASLLQGVSRFSGDQVVMGNNEVTITGYACACPTLAAPTTPARVLDPFSGTGTTSIVADALGRHGIGVDLSWDYHRISRWRFEDGGLRAKALGVEKPAKELEGQLSLLGEAGAT